MIILLMLVNSFDIDITSSQLESFLEFLEETGDLLKLFDFNNINDLENFLIDKYLDFQGNNREHQNLRRF